MFIEAHPEYAAAKWARYLGVSLSGYYSWKDRKEQRQKEADEYKKMIKTIFQKSKSTPLAKSTGYHLTFVESGRQFETDLLAH